MEKYLIHSNELHLIDKQKVHQAVENIVESLELAAGSTNNFDLYLVVEKYFTDLDTRSKINRLVGVAEDEEELAGYFGLKQEDFE